MNNSSSKKAIILLSGGLDSATCVAIAKAQGFDCYGLSFSYGQRHDAELNAAKDIAMHFKLKGHQIIPLALDNLSGTAYQSVLTNTELDVPEYSDSKDIPNTYVPARNTVFLSIALAYAEVVGASHIFIGCSSVDYSGYPDCRPEYIEAFQKMAALATKEGVEGKPVKIDAPLLFLSKAETIALGHQLGMDYSLSVSCYQANELGQACGHCDSCMYRKKGFQESGIADPTIYY